MFLETYPSSRQLLVHDDCGSLLAKEKNEMDLYSCIYMYIHAITTVQYSFLSLLMLNPLKLLITSNIFYMQIADS